MGEGSRMSLARRLRQAREAAGFTLEELAERSEVSKTYLWELEKDEAGEKKPSADILLRIANALSVTLAELLGLPAVRTRSGTRCLASRYSSSRSGWRASDRRFPRRMSRSWPG